MASKRAGAAWLGLARARARDSRARARACVLNSVCFRAARVLLRVCACVRRGLDDSLGMPMLARACVGCLRRLRCVLGLGSVRAACVSVSAQSVSARASDSSEIQKHGTLATSQQNCENAL